MAANFWASTHYKRWIIPKEEVANSNPLDKKYLSELDLKKLRAYFTTWISKLGQQATLRQRVVATAASYWKRFYLKNSFVEFEPALVACTSLYLASKVEECSIHVDRLLTVLPKLPIGTKGTTKFTVTYSVNEVVELNST